VIITKLCKGGGGILFTIVLKYFFSFFKRRNRLPQRPKRTRFWRSQQRRQRQRLLGFQAALAVDNVGDGGDDGDGDDDGNIEKRWTTNWMMNPNRSKTRRMMNKMNRNCMTKGAIHQMN
jgi:hypothetical protein